MKNYTSTLLILLFVISFFTMKANAQQANDDTYIINQYFQSNKEASLLENKLPSATNIQSQDNITLLNQAGNNNIIDIKSNVNDAHTVTQLGDNNYYNSIKYYNNSSSNFNILQKGESNSLQIYGENSIIKNLGIVQKANFKTLIIKNY